MTTKTKHIAILPVAEEPGGSLPAIVVPRLMRIQDAAKYLSATTWQVETLSWRGDKLILAAHLDQIEPASGISVKNSEDIDPPFMR